MKIKQAGLTALIFVLFLAVALTGCNGNPPVQDSPDNSTLKVVATTNIIGDVTNNIGGEKIDLTILIPLGQDPHSFEPTPRDLAAVENADLIFINGRHLEEVLLDAIESTATGQIITVSTGIEPLAFGEASDHEHEEEDQAEDEHAAGDPHFWVDPNNVLIWVENIVQALSAADPQNTPTYTANAEAYRAELLAVDAYIREQVAKIPETNRKLVTDHGLYSYFAEEYGFEIIGAVIPGFTTTAGPSAGEVAALAAVIQEENVPAVFIGATASQGTQSLAEALAEEVGTQIQVLPLLSGSLAPAGEPGDSYLGYLRYNIDQIVTGLSN